MSKQSRFLFVTSFGLMILLGGRATGQVVWDAPPEAKTVKNPVPADKTSLAMGQQLFKNNCTICHGDTGVGDGPMGKQIAIKANLTDAARMTKQTDGEIFWKISKGKDPMPATEPKLPEQARWSLVNYVRTLVKKGK
jgi:mono/diheme cytochrome c family protein